MTSQIWEMLELALAGKEFGKNSSLVAGIRGAYLYVACSIFECESLLYKIDERLVEFDNAYSVQEKQTSKATWG